MAVAVWKGMITFGLVSIPIRLYTAARSKRLALHQIHKKCHTRLKQPLFCPTCNRFLDRSEVVKGFEHESNQYVQVEAEEIKKITPASGHNLEIITFVDQKQVDPIYLDSSYLAMPEEQAEKGYQLLVKALEDTQKIGVGKVTIHQREYTVFIRPRDNGLTLHTMYYANEIASIPAYGKTSEIKLKPEEIKLAEQLVNSLAAPFKPEMYHDEFQDRLAKLIESKMKGKALSVAPQSKSKAPVIDIMEALKRSLARRQEPSGPPVAVSSSHHHRRKKAG